jgi:hypothetical protein
MPRHRRFKARIVIEARLRVSRRPRTRDPRGTFPIKGQARVEAPASRASLLTPPRPGGVSGSRISCHRPTLGPYRRDDVVLLTGEEPIDVRSPPLQRDPLRLRVLGLVVDARDAALVA